MKKLYIRQVSAHEWESVWDPSVDPDKPSSRFPASAGWQELVDGRMPSPDEELVGVARGKVRLQRRSKSIVEQQLDQKQVEDDRIRKDIVPIVEELRAEIEALKQEVQDLKKGKAL